MLETNKSYALYLAGTELHMARLLTISHIVDAGFTPREEDCNLQLGSVSIKDATGTIFEMIPMIDDIGIPSNLLRGCFYAERTPIPDRYMFYFYYLDENHLYTISNTRHLTIDLSFKWLGEELTEDIGEHPLTINITNDASTKYSVEAPSNVQIGDEIVIKLKTSLFSRFNFTDSQFYASHILSFENSQWEVYGSNNIYYELSTDKKELRIIFYAQIVVTTGTYNETINLEDLSSLVIETGFDMVLYQNESEMNKVDKTITQIGTLHGYLREACSIVSPVITIEYSSVPNFNYVYIEEFHRYYFVREITNVRNNLWNIALRVDVLMSYKTTILTQKGYIERNENEFNPFLQDDLLPLTEEKYSIINATSYVDFYDGDLEQQGEYSLVLSVIGKKGSIIDE